MTATAGTVFLQEAFPYLKAECEKMRDRVIVQALAELRAGKMTQERALHCWMEVNAVAAFLKSIETKIKLPQTGETANG